MSIAPRLFPGLFLAFTIAACGQAQRDLADIRYVPIGAPCNICDEEGYALIMGMNADGWLKDEEVSGRPIDILEMPDGVTGFGRYERQDLPHCI